MYILKLYFTAIIFIFSQFIFIKTAVSRTIPLFGKKYEKISIKSTALKGACYYLISGHGGPDPGTTAIVNNHELHEDEYAYDVTLRLAKNLIENSAKVYIIIRDDDDGIRDYTYLRNDKNETCRGKEIPLSQIKRLRQRVAEVNKFYRKDREKYKRAISIHVDSRQKNKELDVFFCHCKKSKKGTAWAEEIAKVFESKYNENQPGRGFEGNVEARNFYVLRNTLPPTLLVEIGNLQNAYNRKRILDYDNRQALANWFCEAFINDYKSSKNHHK